MMFFCQTTNAMKFNLKCFFVFLKGLYMQNNFYSNIRSFLIKFKSIFRVNILSFGKMNEKTLYLFWSQL